MRARTANKQSDWLLEASVLGTPKARAHRESVLNETMVEVRASVDVVDKIVDTLPPRAIERGLQNVYKRAGPPITFLRCGMTSCSPNDPPCAAAATTPRSIICGPQEPK